MSYILDALKKAQAERELGQVPQLGDAPVAVMGAAERPSTTARVRAGWIAAATVFLLLVAALWWWPGATTTAPAVRPVVAAGATAPGVGAVADTSPTRPVVTALPPVLPAPAPPAPPARPAPDAAAMPAQATSQAPAVVTLAPTARLAAPALVPATVPTPVAEAPVVAIDALDPGTRARLPALLNGGTIHSPQREQRMVILDGQVLREGDLLAPDVTVQTIEAGGIILRLGGRFGNQRVRLKP